MLDLEETIRDLREVVDELRECVRRAAPIARCNLSEDVVDNADLVVMKLDKLVWELEWAPGFTHHRVRRPVATEPVPNGSVCGHVPDLSGVKQ